MQIGIREFKNALSHYLRQVQSGQTIVITDRGEPVARIIPTRMPEAIARLMTEGRVTWSGRPFSAPPRLIRPRSGPLFSRYVSEERG